MPSRVKRWLEETHGPGFELLRHFLARFFDSDATSIPGEWQKVAAGILAVLLSFGILLVRTLMERYDLMDGGSGEHAGAHFGSAAIYQAICFDQLLFIAIAMAITAILSALQWESLFPSLRDCLALAGLPVKPRQIFLAKAGALLLVFAVYVLSLCQIPANIFIAITAGHYHYPSTAGAAAASFAALAGGCVFVFFSLLAIQGVLLHLLPARWFERAGLFVQAVVFIATIGALPLVARQPHAWWWPPVWFLEYFQGNRHAAHVAMAVPVALSLIAYLLSYRRYQRLLVENRTLTASAGETNARTAHLLDRWIRDPRELAAFTFISKTLARSRSHRLILMAYAGLALGWITKGALDTPRPNLKDQGVYGLLAVLAPLSLSMLVTVGLRYLFSLPLALRANWAFQITDRPGRIAWLAAVERFVLWCGIAPVFLAGLPAAAAVLGPWRAAAATILGFLAAMLWFERLFRQWRKLPFTCSYLPGKQPAWMLMLRAGVIMPFLAAAGQLFLYSSSEPTAFFAVVTFEAALVWRWRKLRREAWSTAALLYEEEPEAAVMSLDLQPAERLVSTGPAPAEPEMFGGLVASRGILPQSWAEEIDDDRRRPAALLETFVEDVRYGLRLIRRSPLFSAIVVLTLTVGIGINASVFTVASGLALRPHVGADPASFVRIVPMSRDRTTTRQVSYAEYIAWRDHARSVRQLAGYRFFPALVGEDDSTGSFGLAVSCNFFRVEGLNRALLGRVLDAQDCLAPGVAPAAVISDALWRTRLGSDPRIVGRVIQVNNRPVTVVGVVPAGTSGWTRPPYIWLPFTAQAYFDPGRPLFRSDDYLWLSLAGRLAPGYTRSRAEAEFNILAAQQDAEHPGRRTAITTTNGSWMEELYLTASGRALMLIGFLFAAFHLVLLIACANVATLLLSRAAARRREIAVRLSLGAPRIRLVRMLVTESLLLAILAGAASAYLVWRVPVPLYHAVVNKAPDFPMPPDWQTFAYIAAVVLATGLLSGLAPAFESVKVDLAGSLKGTGSGAPGAAGGRVRALLVSAQVAMSMALLVEAGLFAQSEDRNLRADPGYAPQRVVVMPMRFPEGSTVQLAAARMAAIEQRLRALPGVHSVASSWGLPMLTRDTIDLRPPGRPDASQPVDVFTASPHFFETMGIPMIGGREFQETDFRGVVLSQSLSRALWKFQNPIGRSIAVPPVGDVTVIGVVRDVEPMRFGGSDNPAAYILRRIDPLENTMSIRFDAAASSAAPSVRAAIQRMYPDMGVLARPLQKWIDDVVEALWNIVALLVTLGIVATVLATAGIYGAVSFAVNQRTRELGIRVALGAQRGDIVRHVLASGGKPVLHGLLAGLWLSAATAAGLRQSVQGSPLRLDTSNPLLYVAAALLLAAAAIVAMLPAARRGAKSDPLDALRCE
jgi:predicted permease